MSQNIDYLNSETSGIVNPSLPINNFEQELLPKKSIGEKLQEKLEAKDFSIRAYSSRYVGYYILVKDVDSQDYIVEIRPSSSAGYLPRMNDSDDRFYEAFSANESYSNTVGFSTAETKELFDMIKKL